MVIWIELSYLVLNINFLKIIFFRPEKVPDPIKTTVSQENVTKKHPKKFIRNTIFTITITNFICVLLTRKSCTFLKLILMNIFD